MAITSRKHRSKSPSLPKHAQEEDKVHKKRSQNWRSSKTCLFNLADEVIFSEQTRKLLWVGTLILIFLLERRRTILRSKKDLFITRVVSGIIIETPEDALSSSKISENFVNITTGSMPFEGSKACGFNEFAASCRIYHPFVDYREFDREHSPLRLKQVMRIPSDQDSFALLTQRGIGSIHESGNQDRSMLVYPFYLLDIKGAATDFLLLALDGHGSEGSLIAQAAMQDFPTSLIKEFSRTMKATGGKNSSLHRVMTEVMVNTFNRVDRHVPDSLASGTTLSVTLKLFGYLHVASVGDTQTFVVAYKDETIKIIYATRPDKPDVPTERERILARGGSLWLPPQTSRGIQPPPKVYFEIAEDPNSNETTSYVLGVSRSIGDRVAHASGGVVAEPIVASLPVSAFTNDGRQLFVFAATDGLLEKVAPLTIAERLAASLYRNDTVSPLETIEGILLDANQAWSRSRTMENGELMNVRDDVSLVVVKVLP